MEDKTTQTSTSKELAAPAAIMRTEPPTNNLPSLVEAHHAAVHLPSPAEMPQGFSGINTGLLRFCIEHSDYKEGAAQGIPERDPADYEFLRAAFKSMEDDVAKMRRCVGVCTKEDATEKEKALALEELQFLVEDLDNANDLHKLNCFEPVLHMLRDPSPTLRMWATWVVATVAQNNPEGQSRAIEKGALEEVIELFNSEQDDTVLSKALLALSALVKSNNDALHKFISADGLKALASVLSPEGQRSVSTNSKMKAVFFLTHILRQHAPLRDEFREIGAIEYLIPLLKDEDLDLREKALLAFNELLVDNRTNAKYCIRLSLHSMLQQRVKDIDGAKADEKERLGTELEYCKQVYELLRKKN